MGEATDNTYYDDGGFPFDGQVFTYANKSFILEDFTPVEPSHWVRSNGLSGAPRGGRHVADEIAGSGMCQFPSGATTADAPKRFAEITLKHRGADKVFIIQEVGQPQKSGTEIKCSLKLMERFVTPAGN